MSGYEDGFWWSNDGLRLHYRDYPGPADRPPILCIPGLTRNARDYAPVAERLSPEWRVLCLELRGRGESAYAPDSLTYAPLTYVQDIERLLIEAGIGRFILFGSSLGGLVSMLLTAAEGSRVAGVLLNDIGPDIDPSGLSRIRGFVGRAVSWPTWVHAARYLERGNAAGFPDYALPDWLRMAKELYRITRSGKIVPDYDLKIAEPFKLASDPYDWWPVFDALRDIPTLVVRGECSDILGAETAEKMGKRLKKGLIATVARTGHTPRLTETEAIAGIDALLAKIA